MDLLAFFLLCFRVRSPAATDEGSVSADISGLFHILGTAFQYDSHGPIRVLRLCSPCPLPRSPSFSFTVLVFWVWKSLTLTLEPRYPSNPTLAMDPFEFYPDELAVQPQAKEVFCRPLVCVGTRLCCRGTCTIAQGRVCSEISATAKDVDLLNFGGVSLLWCNDL